MKTLVNVTCMPDGKGIRFDFEDGTSSVLEPGISVGKIPSAQSFVDMTLASAILALHMRVIKLEQQLNPQPVEEREWWSCTNCGEKLYDRQVSSSAWRWCGDIWEHKCPGTHPQIGHNPAVRKKKCPDCVNGIVCSTCKGSGEVDGSR